MDKKLLKYWKNCLLDAERRSRSLKKEARVTLRIGDKVPEFILRKDIPLLFPKGKQKTDDEKRKIQIAPCVFLPEYENGWASGQNTPEYPFLISATLLPDGTFQVCDNKSERIPVFVRKFLSPNARNDRTIASLSNVDRLLSEFDTEETDWKIYWSACEKLFQDATGLTFREMNYADKPEIIVVKAPGRGMAQKIINLYDKLLESKSSHPLLELLIRKKLETLLPVPDRQQVYCNKDHWAQMSGEFPLSVSQRETLAMYTDPDSSDIFAVNGPPGTGKTSCALKKMVETFHADKDAQILLLSYTNRAVDEICKSLASIAPAVDFIRVGSELSCDEAYRGHLIENELSSCNRRSEVYERIRNCRIIVGTVAAISGKPELFRLKHFDVAIIDEATQILEPQLLGILCARGEDGKDAIDKFVLIGDHKQLPAVVQQNTEQSAIYDESLLSIGLTNLKDSLFERLYRNCTATVHRSYDMLCRQGRMHPEVALFANRAFYGGRLIPVGLPHQIESSDTICRLAFYPSVPEKAGASAKINYSEARIVADLAVRIYEDHQTDFDESRTLGIITPYRSQIALIKKEIESLGIPALNRILVDTVERFQGSERDVIIYSFCVNYPYQLKFLSNLTEEEGVLIDRKLNVALTRARKQMFITGVPELLERNPLYKSLLKLIESF